jgi:predicted transporter
MGLVICSFSVLCLFFLRDVFVLGAKQEHLPGKLFLYAVVMSLYLPGAMGIAHPLPHQRAIALLSSPWVWTTVLAIHAGQWRFATWVRHAPDRKERMWLTILAPAPMFLLSAVVFSNRIAGPVDSAGALTAGFVVFAVWTALVLAGVLVFRFVYREWEDWDCVAEVAEITSWTGLGILPFAGVFSWLEVLLSYD